MDYQVTDKWDEALWNRAERVYREAFPEHGRKNRSIVKRMFEREICTLHVWSEHSAAVAMALTAYDRAAAVLVIDYIAVDKRKRGRGIGLQCIRDIRRWAEDTEPDCKGIVIEAEAGPGRENENRIRFWEKAGFRLTDYVQSYIWVPETYRAMSLCFDESDPLPEDGKLLFKPILKYHERAYRSKG